MKNRNSFICSLPILAIFFLWQPNTRDMYEANQPYHPIFDRFIPLGMKDILSDFLNEIRAKSFSSQKEESDDSPAKFSSTSDDLVSDGRQISLESDIRIFESINENCSLTYRHPKISGMKDESLQAEINRNLAKEINDLTDYFFSYLDEDEDCTNQTDLYKAHLEVSPCVVTLVKDEIVSMNCTSILIGRAVYPITTSRGINLNLRTGEFYSFDDLFDKEYDYSKGMIDILLDGNNLNHFEKQLIPNIEEDTIFYIDSDCPIPLASSTCIAIPTNGTSGASRGVTLFADIEELEGTLSSERIAEVLLDRQPSRVPSK